MRTSVVVVASCAVALFAGGLVAQDVALQKARVHLHEGRHAAARGLAQEALALDADSADWLMILAKSLHGLGQRGAARECRDRLANLQGQRLQQLDRLLATSPAVAEAGATSPIGATGPIGAIGTADAVPVEGAANPPKSPEEVDAEAAADRVTQRKRLKSKDDSVRKDAVKQLRKNHRETVRRIVADAAGGDHKRGLGRIRTLFTEARMRARKKEVAPGEGFVENLLGPVLDLIAAQILAHTGPTQTGGDDSAAADAYAAELRSGVELMVEIEAEQRAIAALDQLIAVESLSARALAALSSTLEGWVATIESMQFASEKQRKDRVEGLAQLGERLQRGRSTREAGEDLFVQLRKSKSRWLEGRVGKILIAWAQAREAEGDAAAQRGNAPAAARSYERAYICEPSQPKVLAKAADQFEQAELWGDAARVHKILAQNVGAASNESIVWLNARWGEAAGRLPDLGIDPAQPVVLTSLPNEKESLAKYVDRIERHMPVLVGPELASVRGRIVRGDHAGAQKALHGVLEAIRKGTEPQWRGGELGGRAPRLAENFRVPSVSAPCVWVEGATGEPGFWRFAGPANLPIWDKALSVRWDIFERNGIIEVSAANAQAVCDAIHDTEGELQRLPAGYRYALPTLREVHRMRDAEGRLPGVSCERIWTRDEGDGYSEHGHRLRRTAWVARRDYKDQDPWKGDFGIGFVIVLTRK